MSLIRVFQIALGGGREKIPLVKGECKNVKDITFYCLHVIVYVNKLL